MPLKVVFFNNHTWYFVLEISSILAGIYIWAMLTCALKAHGKHSINSKNLLEKKLIFHILSNKLTQFPMFVFY